MSFGRFEIQELVEEVQRTQVWGFNVYVEVDDAYVEEIGDDNYEIEVDIKAYGSADVHDDYEFRRLKDGIQSAGRTIMDRIGERLDRYHDRYGFGYRVRVRNFDTSDVEVESD